MTKRKDPFAIANADYDIFVNGLSDKVTTNQAAWVIDLAAVTAIAPLLTTWNSTWKISKNKTTSTSTDREATRLARIALTEYLRPFVQKWVYLNPAMTTDDIVACGLDPKDKTRTPVGAPETEPDMDYKVGGTHVISAFFRQQPGQDGVSRRGKPQGVGSIKVAYYIGTTPPTNPEDYPKMIMGTRSPVKILFNPADAAKLVTFAACWISKSNLPGNWSETQVMVIP